jgi:hypothetical protein
MIAVISVHGMLRHLYTHIYVSSSRYSKCKDFLFSLHYYYCPVIFVILMFMLLIFVLGLMLSTYLSDYCYVELFVGCCPYIIL